MTNQYHNPVTAERKQQLKELLMQAAPNKDIAAKLHISLRTVKAEMSRLFRHYDITDGVKRVKLARLLYEQQWRVR